MRSKLIFILIKSMLSNEDSREVIEIVTATSLWKIAVLIRKIIHHESSTGGIPPSITRGCCRIRGSPYTDFHTRTQTFTPDLKLSNTVFKNTKTIIIRNFKTIKIKTNRNTIRIKAINYVTKT